MLQYLTRLGSNREHLHLCAKLVSESVTFVTGSFPEALKRFKAVCIRLVRARAVQVHELLLISLIFVIVCNKRLNVCNVTFVTFVDIVSGGEAQTHPQGVMELVVVESRVGARRGRQECRGVCRAR